MAAAAMAQLFPGLHDDGLRTPSSEEQQEVEASVERLLKEAPSPLVLWRDRHVKYLLHGLTTTLSRKFQSLDASRPWLCYWMTHSLRLLDVSVPVLPADGPQGERDLAKLLPAFLATCQDPRGGFGGGPGQAPHLATTYAAVMALANVKDPAALDLIDRPNLLRFLLSVRQANGSFVLHEDGEVDIRGVYLAAAAATVCQLPLEELFEGSAAWLARCQTYEGGFGGAPGCEAHGGYAYCGLAALLLLGHPGLAHTPSLERWLALRQTSLEGGFSGRANKLVDGCYSFWQAASFPLVEAAKEQQGDHVHRTLFHREALQRYILAACQWPTGGLVDKPGKTADFYHTCYVLSGLSVAQHSDPAAPPFVLGDPANLLAKTHPLLNVRMDVAEFAHDHFAAKGPFQAS